MPVHVLVFDPIRKWSSSDTGVLPPRVVTPKVALISPPGIRISMAAPGIFIPAASFLNSAVNAAEFSGSLAAGLALDAGALTVAAPVAADADDAEVGDGEADERAAADDGGLGVSAGFDELVHAVVINASTAAAVSVACCLGRHGCRPMCVGKWTISFTSRAASRARRHFSTSVKSAADPHCRQEPPG